MTLVQLRYFVAIAEEGDFTRAGAREQSSQPTISGAIRHLETSLGCRLCERDSHHVELTPAGQVLLPIAKSLVALADRAVEEVKRITGMCPV